MKFIDSVLVLFYSFSSVSADNARHDRRLYQDFSYSMPDTAPSAKSGKGSGKGGKSDEQSSKSGKGGVENEPFSFSYDFSMPFNAKSGKMWKSGKVGKTWNSAKSGKSASYDECQVIANPLIELTYGGIDVLEEYLGSGRISGFDSDFWLEHNHYINVEFSDAVDSWVNGGASSSSIIKMGQHVSHPAECQDVCNALFYLIKQMEDTCNYSNLLSAYANVAANFMKGFSMHEEEGLGSVFRIGSSGRRREDNINLLKCEYDGKTFKEVYGDLLTQDTFNAIRRGNVCSSDLAP